MVVASGDLRLPRLRSRAAQGQVDRLYRKHGDEVLRYARLVLRSGSDAEDVAQTTFMRALRALERGEVVEKPRNWLIKIAHNECRRVLQARQRRNVEVELEDVPVEPPEHGRADELRRALSHLAPNQREALVLRELEGRSYAEIAAMLQISESAVETLIFRARRALREQLEDVVGCHEVATLLQAEVLSLDERRKLRAHTRACTECAALERQARGRKSAVRRLVSSIGLPWWGGKVALVALGVGAAATTFGYAVAEPRPHTFPATNVTPVHVGRPPAPIAPARARHHHRLVVHRAPVKHPAARAKSPEALRAVERAAARRAAPAGHAPASVVGDPAPPPQPTTPVQAPAGSSPQPEAAPTSAAPAPARAAGAQPVTVKPVPVTAPTVTVPPETVPTPAATVTTPTVTTPTVTTPTATVAVPSVTPPPLPLPGP